MGTRAEFERWVLRKKRKSGDVVKEVDPRDVVMVLEWEGRAVGVCCVWGPEAEVWGWVVERRYRGRGLGRDLLVETVKEWRKRNPGREVEELKVMEECPCGFPLGLGTM